MIQLWSLIFFNLLERPAEMTFSKQIRTWVTLTFFLRYWQYILDKLDSSSCSFSAVSNHLYLLWSFSFSHFVTLTQQMLGKATFKSASPSAGDSRDNFKAANFPSCWNSFSFMWRNICVLLGGFVSCPTCVSHNCVSHNNDENGSRSHGGRHGSKWWKWWWSFVLL